MTLSWLLIITILAAVFAIVDGIRRVRGRNNSILAVAELVLAVLMLISVFIAFPAPFSTFIFALALEVVLILLLVFRGGRTGGYASITVIALILNTIVVLIALGWLTIPGLG